MKKILLSIVLSTLMFTITGCGNIAKQQNSKLSRPSINNVALKEGGKEDMIVEIISNSNQNSFSKMPITLTPKLQGEYGRELQYHWILENINDFEGFYIPEKGPQKEIINSGESVKLSLFAEVDWKAGAVSNFKVKLQVEDKETSQPVAINEITIENNAGVYKVK